MLCLFYHWNMKGDLFCLAACLVSTPEEIHVLGAEKPY